MRGHVRIGCVIGPVLLANDAPHPYEAAKAARAGPSHAPDR